MTFEQSIKTCFKKYAVFSGRASRSEYWWWALFDFLGFFLISIFDNAIFDISPKEWGPFSALFWLITFLPYFAVTARRLHDINRTGWWVVYWPLIMLAPIFIVLLFFPDISEDSADNIWFLVIVGVVICIIWQIVWFASRGTQGDNRFGPDPLASQIQESERQES